MSYIYYKVLTILLLLSAMESAAKTDSIEIQNLFNTAHRLYEQQQADTALILLKKALVKSKAISYKVGIANINRLMGDVHLGKGKLERAQQYYQEALQHTTAHDSAIISSALNGLAISYQLQGDYNWALDHFQKAIILLPETKQARVYCNMGSVCNDLQESDKAIYYFEKATQLADKYNDYLLLVDIWNNEAVSYAIKKDLPRAEQSFQKALTLANKHNFEDCKQLTYTNMGAFAMENHDLDKAIAYLLIAKKIPTSMHPVYYSLTDINLGAAYLEKQNYDSALFFLLNVIDTAKQLKQPLWLSKTHEYIAYAYKGLGRYTLAFDHLVQSKVISDSLNKREKIEAVNRIEARFRTSQKDQEITKNRLLINKQQADIYRKNIGIALAAFTLLALAVVIALLRRSNRHKQALKDEKLQHMIKEQELSKMKAMMNGEERERSRIARELHDGIMVHLSASKMHLNALVINDQQEMVPTMGLLPVIEALNIVSEDLRRTAHNLMPDLLLAEGLAEAVYYFCNSIKKNGRLEIQYNPINEIPRFLPEFELSVYRIIQELLQNVIKHAQATDIYLQLNYDNSLLNIVIEDNGIGIASDTIEHGQGMGLKSIKQRLPTLGGKIEIDSTSDGTSINLEFDLS